MLKRCIYQNTVNIVTVRNSISISNNCYVFDPDPSEIILTFHIIISVENNCAA